MKNVQSKYIVMTGGHGATTAIAVVQEIQDINRQLKLKEVKALWKVYWIGSSKAVEGADTPSLEFVTLPKMGVCFIEIRTGRLQRKFTRWTIPSLFKIPLGFVDSFRHLAKIKPKVVLSFGGFAAFPVVICAKILKIPVVLHEQTIAVGRANKMSAPYADTITLARPESKKYFQGKSTKTVGNPLMKNILQVKTKLKIGNPPCLFITGGSRGAQSINALCEAIIEKLLKDFVVIHQTGKPDYNKFLQLKKSIPANYRKRYTVYETIEPANMHEVYNTADIIVSRAGANMVAEIMHVKRPSILIPLPFSYLDEQRKNAVLAEKFGMAKVIDQESTTPQTLYEQIIKTKKDWQLIVDNIKNKVSPDSNAAKDLVDVVRMVGRLA